MKRILLQGITSENHLSAVKHVLALDCPERVILSAAFMNKGGISLVRDSLEPVAEQCTILAGIRNGITSAQGLAACLELGCPTYAVDTGQQQIIFHPKIYMSRNPNEARLAVGSANLTAAGLLYNIEASLLLDLALGKPDERDLINELENLVVGMIAEYSENVLRISSHRDINSLLYSKRVIDETDDSGVTNSISPISHEQDTVPKMKLKVSRYITTSSRDTIDNEVATPKQVEFIVPLQVALRQLGGSGTNDEIFERVVQIMKLSADQLGVIDTIGRNKVKNLLAFAKVRLKLWQYIDGTPQGSGRYWLTEKGLTESINDPQSLLRDPD